MNKKTKILIGVVLIGIICSVAVFFMGGNKVDLDETSALEAIRNEFKAVINYNEDQSNNPLMAKICEGFEVEILSFKKKKEDYVVKCNLSNYDVVSAFNSIDTINKEMTLEEYGEMISSVVGEQEKLSTEAEIKLSIVNDEYRIIFTEEQIDAATGGLISYYKNLLGEVEQ